MKTGFLLLETSSSHPGLVRVRLQELKPALPGQAGDTEIRYVARFKDIEAAQMHVQNMMHSALVNLENRVYRKPLAEMIACVEADELDHKREWLDPALDPDELNRIQSLVERHKIRHKRVDLFWQAVGILGLLLLLISGFSL